MENVPRRSTLAASLERIPKRVEQECNVCKVSKSIDKFEWQKDRPNPRKTCKKCRHEQRDYKKEYPKRNAQRRAKYREDPDKYRRSWERTKYGHCKEDFKYKSCWICGSKKRLSIDHDHSTGEVRGLLCSHCNTGLGFFKDNRDSLNKAIAYLNTDKSEHLK